MSNILFHYKYIFEGICDRDRFANSYMRHYVFSFDVQCESVV